MYNLPKSGLLAMTATHQITVRRNTVFLNETSNTGTALTWWVMAQHLSDSDYTDMSKKVEYISYCLGNHGKDHCFYERLNTLNTPAPAAVIHHCFVVKKMWMMMLVLNDAITIIVIAVIVNIVGDSRGNERIFNISHIRLPFVRGNYCCKFYCSFLFWITAIL